jgi:hypothetical protein
MADILTQGRLVFGMVLTLALRRDAELEALLDAD